jgi:hypothetical protein
MNNIFNILPWIVICLLIIPHIYATYKKYKRSIKEDQRPIRNRISASVSPELYNMVIEAAKMHKCTITAYITQALQERLQRERVADVHTS